MAGPCSALSSELGHRLRPWWKKSVGCYAGIPAIEQAWDRAKARNDDRKGYRLLTKKLYAEFDGGVSGGMSPMTSTAQEKARHHQRPAPNYQQQRCNLICWARINSCS